MGRFIQADTIVQAPYDPQSLNRYAYCRNNPIKYVDPSGHFWGIIAAIIGAIIGGVTAHQAGENPVVGALIGAAAGFIGGYLGSQVFAPAIAGNLGAAAETFWGGFLTGGVEFGTAGFFAGAGTALAAGESFGDSMKAGGIGFGAGFITGGIIQGTYMAGWQDALHGMSREDVVQARLNKISSLVRRGDLQKATDLLNGLQKQHDLIVMGTRDAAHGLSVLDIAEVHHVDLYASKTSGAVASVGFDFKPKTPMNYIKVGFNQKVGGAFRAGQGIVQGRYDTLILKSMDSMVVDKAIPIMQDYIGRTHYYKLLGNDAYNCQHGAAEILGQIGLE